MGRELVDKLLKTIKQDRCMKLRGIQHHARTRGPCEVNGGENPVRHTQAGGTGCLPNVRKITGDNEGGKEGDHNGHCDSKH